MRSSVGRVCVRVCNNGSNDTCCDTGLGVDDGFALCEWCVMVVAMVAMVAVVAMFAVTVVTVFTVFFVAVVSGVLSERHARHRRCSRSDRSGSGCSKHWWVVLCWCCCIYPLLSSLFPLFLVLLLVLLSFSLTHSFIHGGSPHSLCEKKASIPQRRVGPTLALLHFTSHLFVLGFPAANSYG
jgi:hypothetical protein